MAHYTSSSSLAASKKNVHMDTSDLSLEAYEAIIIQAEKLDHNLTIHYGIMSDDCKNETEYLTRAIVLTKEIMQMDRSEVDDLFWGNPPKKNDLMLTLQEILNNIEIVNKKEISKRHYD